MSCEPGQRCEDNQECCCPPPGGGLVVPLVQHTIRVPDWPQWAAKAVYLCWEVPLTCRFDVTLVRDHRASGHIAFASGDGMAFRADQPIAYTQEQVDWYLTHRTIFQGIVAAKLTEARAAFSATASEPYSKYGNHNGGGVFDARHAFAPGSIGLWEPWSYPDLACPALVLRDADGIDLHATFASGHGCWRTIRNAQILRPDELMDWREKRAIWVPLYDAAVGAAHAEFDSEYPNPYTP